MDIEENTLYPLLRRLETQGLLDSEWREEDKRNKRFYRLVSRTARRSWLGCSTVGRHRSRRCAGSSRRTRHDPGRSIPARGQGQPAARPAGRHHQRAVGEPPRPDRGRGGRARPAARRRPRRRRSSSGSATRWWSPRATAATSAR